MNLVLTGSTSGIGWETLKALMPLADSVFLPVRNIKKAEKMIQHLFQKEKIVLIPMDLSIMAEVKKGAMKIQDQCKEIHLLINNAGGMFPAGKKTSEGLDLTFATNHLGHFLLTGELMPALIQGKAKIIHVSSIAHQIATQPSKDFGLLKSANTGTAYGKVKLYNILFSNELKNRFESKGISTYTLHPGAVKTAFGSETSLWAKAIISISKLIFISPKSGAQTSIFLATTPKSQLRNGGYYIRKKPKTPSSLARNKELSTALWNYSEEVLKNLGVI
jgi:NAD(P)-dependent dehydrogenase (short-subunit alcohol dehydrogenase family)